MSHLIIPVTEKDHIRNAFDAPITIVEYGDYQCPFCFKAYQVLSELLKKTQGVRFVFRNFPLKQAHPFAVLAAEVAEAAALQNRFWEVHDFLYEHQILLSSKNLLDSVKQYGIDIERLKNDQESPKVRGKIEADFQGGILSGVNGTPSLYINDELYDGAITIEALSQALTAKFLF